MMVNAPKQDLRVVRTPLPASFKAGFENPSCEPARRFRVNPELRRSARQFWALSAWLWLLVALTAAAMAAEKNGSGRGFDYVNDKDPSVPWSIHVLRIDRSRPDLELCTTLGRTNTFAMTLVSEQVKALPPDAGVPIAAVNGDFYGNSENYRGRPRDLQIYRGELVSNPSGHTCFWIDATGNPSMTNLESRFRVIWPDETITPFGLNEERGSEDAVVYTDAVGASTRTRGGLELTLERGTNFFWLPLRVGQTYSARVRELRHEGDTPLSREVLVLSIGPDLASRLPPISVGTTLKLVTETFPDLTGAKTAIGGGPSLVRDGQPMQWSGLQFRHPRTAIGWNKKEIFLVEVDGRQSSLSLGMSFPELAAYMVKLGCDQAMNLDGGGSSTFWMLGGVVNSPSEGHERPAANALVLLEKRAPKQ